MPPVDEQQAEGCRPVAGHGGGGADDRDDHVFQPGIVKRAPKEGEGVHATGARVDDFGVVVLPPGLVLLGSVVVVNAEQHGAGRPRRRAQVDRRLPAVRADLEEWPDAAAGQTGLMQGAALVVGHEALRADRDREDVVVE
jgi:hypothetical protein